MLVLEQIIVDLPKFSAWKYADKIRFFCWYLEAVEQAPITDRRIAQLFDEANVRKPTAIGPFLNAMTGKDTPELVRKSDGGFSIERGARKVFDERYGLNRNHRVDEALGKFEPLIKRPHEVSYFVEDRNCFSAKAYRAAMIMTWNLSFSHLVSWLVEHHLEKFNEQLSKSYPKEPLINSEMGFSYLKESDVLTVIRSARIVPEGTYKVLKEKLDRRNAIAHPSALVVAPQTAEEYMIDLLENVVLGIAS